MPSRNEGRHFFPSYPPLPPPSLPCLLPSLSLSPASSVILPTPSCSLILLLSFHYTFISSHFTPLVVYIHSPIPLSHPRTTVNPSTTNRSFPSTPFNLSAMCTSFFHALPSLRLSLHLLFLLHPVPPFSAPPFVTRCRWEGREGKGKGRN